LKIEAGNIPFLKQCLMSKAVIGKQTIIRNSVR
jgi:hypothetical protein